MDANDKKNLSFYEWIAVEYISILKRRDYEMENEVTALRREVSVLKRDREYVPISLFFLVFSFHSFFFWLLLLWMKVGSGVYVLNKGNQGRSGGRDWERIIQIMQ